MGVSLGFRLQCFDEWVIHDLRGEAVLAFAQAEDDDVIRFFAFGAVDRVLLEGQVWEPLTQGIKVGQVVFEPGEEVNRGSGFRECIELRHGALNYLVDSLVVRHRSTNERHGRCVCDRMGLDVLDDLARVLHHETAGDCTDLAVEAKGLLELAGLRWPEYFFEVSSEADVAARESEDGLPIVAHAEQ